MNHASVAIPVLKWRRRGLEKDLNREMVSDWNKPVSIENGVKDLKAIANLQYLNHVNGTKLTLTWEPMLEIITDASPKGWGAVLNASWGSRQVQGQWTEADQELTSNQKELKGISLAYFAFKQFIPEKADVLIKTDNTTAIAYVKGRGKLTNLMEIVKPMVNSMLKKRLTIRCTHIPGKENTVADHLSRCFPKKDHDWNLSQEAYQTITNRWGPMAFDMFADWMNAKVKRYASWGPDPTSEVVDILSQSWGTIPSPWYLVPPWPLIPKVVAKIRQELQRGEPSFNQF